MVIAVYISTTTNKTSGVVCWITREREREREKEPVFIMEDEAVVVLQKLEDQLTCSICLEEYSHPKALPCLHSFCLKCIDSLIPKFKVYNYV